jgi:hypothetical protein
VAVAPDQAAVAAIGASLNEPHPSDTDAKLLLMDPAQLRRRVSAAAEA